MSARPELFATNNLRKFLFWFRYDGSKFASMAKGGDLSKGPTVIQLVESCLNKIFGKELSDTIKTFVVSRTDAKVHAIRSPVLVGLPDTCNSYDQFELTGTKFLNYFNGQIQRIGYADAMELLRINPVASGFHPGLHVAYRRYTYRLRVASSEQSQNYPDRFMSHLNHMVPPNPTLADISEFNYSWTIPPNFRVERAQFVCDLLMKPGQNFASFLMHTTRQRRKDQQYRSVTRRRQLMLLQIRKGESYHSVDDDAQFFNLDFVAHGYMRQQIRRMVCLIAKTACDTSGRDPRRIYDFLLKDPDPLRFHQANLKAAPSCGLFLTDVVYDPRMFTNPIPEYFSAWEFNKTSAEDDDYDTSDEVSTARMTGEENEQFADSEDDDSVDKECAAIGSL